MTINKKESTVKGWQDAQKNLATAWNEFIPHIYKTLKIDKILNFINEIFYISFN